MNIEKMMNRNVRSCSESDTLNRAAQLMWEGDCGFLPVVDQQQHVVGVVTDRDICMGAYTKGVPLWGASVSSVMTTKDVQTCHANDELADVERLMGEKQVRRVPVVDGSGSLLGIVTLGDFARCSQASAFQKATGGFAIAKTLAGICEPRPPQEGTVAAE